MEEFFACLNGKLKLNILNTSFFFFSPFLSFKLGFLEIKSTCCNRQYSVRIHYFLVISVRILLPPNLVQLQTPTPYYTNKPTSNNFMYPVWNYLQLNKNLTVYIISLRNPLFGQRNRISFSVTATSQCWHLLANTCCYILVETEMLYTRWV